MNQLLWIFLGMGCGIYILIGLWVLGNYFWCFGTAQSNPTTKIKFINSVIAIGLVLLWPFFYLWLGGMIIYDYVQHLKTKKKKVRLYTCIGKGGRYKCYGETIGAGTSKGESVVIYQDIDSKKLFHRTRDDFDKRMKLLDK